MNVRVNLVGDGFGDERLPRAGRAVQEDALRRVDAELLEQFGVAHRQFDHLADLFEFAVEAADVLVGHIGRVARFRCALAAVDLLGGHLADLNVCGVGHDDRAGGLGLCDLQRDLLAGHEESGPRPKLAGTVGPRDGLPAEVVANHRPDVAPNGGSAAGR